MAQVQKVTEEQAAEALKGLFAQNSDEEIPAPAPATPEPSEPKPAEPVVQEPPAETPAPEQEVSQSDDVESLKKRLADSEAAKEQIAKDAAARVEAIRTRTSQNESILRERYLRKATVTDKALRALKAARSETGIEKAEVDRTIAEIEGTLNPNSAQYAAPVTEPGAVLEDQALTLNSFLNEKGLSASEADAFGNWMKTEASKALSPMEQAIAGRDLDGFLRLAHTRFVDSQSQQSRQRRDEAVGAVRSVQITQREAARAASSTPAAPRKTPAGPKTELTAADYKKFTKDDVSTLLRQSVEQYR